MLSTFGNTESMCAAQGALFASFADPDYSPKAFFQSTYGSCTIASFGTCASYSDESQLATPLPVCAPAYTAAAYAIASYYAAGAPQTHAAEPGCCGTCYDGGCDASLLCKLRSSCRWCWRLKERCSLRADPSLHCAYQSRPSKHCIQIHSSAGVDTASHAQRLRGSSSTWPCRTSHHICTYPIQIFQLMNMGSPVLLVVEIWPSAPQQLSMRCIFPTGAAARAQRQSC